MLSLLNSHTHSSGHLIVGDRQRTYRLRKLLLLNMYISLDHVSDDYTGSDLSLVASHASLIVIKRQQASPAR